MEDTRYANANKKYSTLTRYMLSLEFLAVSTLYF
jgi:hypothetical protein